MIVIEKTKCFGWEEAIRGMRNPMNSWDKSDSFFGRYTTELDEIGKNDFSLMKKLSAAGADHGKFLRMITVYTDITAPLYWWKEFDTYKVGTVANSCSTMHKIHDKEFTLDDFSHDKLDGFNVEHLEKTIAVLNTMRDLFLISNKKHYWWQMIQLLPSSYNQKRTVMLNYQVLKNMYHARKNHKLDEWHVFCDWIKKLPYSELITGESNEQNDQQSC